MSARWLGPTGLALAIAGVVLIAAGAAIGPDPRTGGVDWPAGGRAGGLPFGPGMMGGFAGGRALDDGPQPGDEGFVAGTAEDPRVIAILAGPGATFTPSAITVQRGETIAFRVTTMGPIVHEFMVGPADAVAADVEGTPEIDRIGMMDTRALTYTFDGSGPYAFACHVDGHYEAGMAGTIVVVG